MQLLRDVLGWVSENTKELTRNALAIGVVGTYLYLVVQGQNIPDSLSNIVVISVVGYYFDKVATAKR